MEVKKKKSPEMPGKSKNNSNQKISKNLTDGLGNIIQKTISTFLLFEFWSKL